MGCAVFPAGFVVGAAVAVAPALAQTGAAEAYPAKPVRVIVPYTPGGANDILARTLIARAVGDLGQNVIVDNRPGGNTTIGTQLAARAVPDGYTLLTVDNAYTIGPSIQRNLQYDTLKDFVRITMLAMTSSVWVVHPSLPAASVKALLALAKIQPGRLTYGTTGSGTTGHLAFAQIKHVAGIDMVHVPYKGGAPQITALLSGEVAMLFSVPPALLTHIKSGRMRALATSGAKRLPALPDVPTLQEAGLPLTIDAFWGLVAPANTQTAIVTKLHEAIERAAKTPELRTRLEDMQLQPASTTPAQFEAFIQREVNRWLGVVKATGVKMD